MTRSRSRSTPAPAKPAKPADTAVINGYVNAVNDTASQKLTGTAENGSTVKIYDNGNFVTSTTADASTGAWSYTIGALADASTHSYTVTATDAAGNVSAVSDALSFTVDTTAPTISWTPATATGVQAGAISLGTLASDSNLSSLVISGATAGAVLSDGINSYSFSWSNGFRRYSHMELVGAEDYFSERYQFYAHRGRK